MNSKEYDEIRKRIPSIKMDKSSLKSATLTAAFMKLGKKQLRAICQAFHVDPARSNYDTAVRIISSNNVAFELRLAPSLDCILCDDMDRVNDLMIDRITHAQSPWLSLIKAGKFPQGNGR